MASGTLGDSNDDLNWRGRCRWTENSKVYTRKTHKKVQKICNNSDTAPTSTSTAEKPISATPTPTDAEVCPASPPPTIPSSTTTPNGTADAHAVQEQESVGVVGAKDAASCQNSPVHSLHQNQGHPLGSPDRNADSSCPAPLPEQKLSEHVPSVSEDSYHIHDRIDEDNGSQAAELHGLEDSRIPDNDEAKNLDKAQTPELSQERSEPSPVRDNNLLNKRGDSSARQPIGNAEENDGLVQTHGLRPQERSEPSLSGENDLPNGRDDSPDQQLIENEEQNDGMVHGSFQISQDNVPIKVNGVKSPPVYKVQLPVVDEGQDDEEMMPGSPQVSEGNGRGNGNGVVKPLVISSIDDRIRFNLCKATPKNEIKKLKKNLEYELDQVRRLFKQLESEELRIASHNAQVSNNNLNKTNSVSAEGVNSGEYILPQTQHARSNVVDRRLLLRVNAEVGAIAHQETRPIGLARVNSDVGATRNLEPRLYNRQLSVSVMDNRSSEYTEKEKRTPKANQYYRNSEFLLGKDRLPSESNKRLKTNNGRKHSGETDHAMGFGFGFDKNRNQVFKNCSSLLQRLMKHKFGWVFNEPVNAKALGLVDYHDIIKHPMDLGTIKTRLSQNLYKSPREFAEDVRLVFHNAMTYNPKGQDVHIMAEQLLQIFEERWAVIESEYNPYWKYQLYQEGGLPTPTSRKGVPYPHFGPASVSVSAPAPALSSVPLYASVAPQRTSDRPEPGIPFMAVDPKMHRPHVGRTPVPKKPKAKDPNKRDMTYEEKQRLSTHLQGLPPEKLDSIVQIIKKRNTALSQHDDEIEVDIDSVDAETLWELDRFVTNYKKSLSKNKRKAELALQARMANQNVMLTNSTPGVAIQNESGTDFRKGTTLVDEQERNNGSRSSSSSSSSSDSGSTSSDSDSDSSSGDGSDAGHSPKT